MPLHSRRIQCSRLSRPIHSSSSSHSHASSTKLPCCITAAAWMCINVRNSDPSGGFPLHLPLPRLPKAAVSAGNTHTTRTPRGVSSADSYHGAQTRLAWSSRFNLELLSCACHRASLRYSYSLATRGRHFNGVEEQQATCANLWCQTRRCFARYLMRAR